MLVLKRTREDGTTLTSSEESDLVQRVNEAYSNDTAVVLPYGWDVNHVASPDYPGEDEDQDDPEDDDDESCDEEDEGGYDQQYRT